MTFDWPKSILTPGLFTSGARFFVPGIALLLGATMAVPASAIEVSASLVRDIREGSSESLPHFLEDVNGTLFFVANDGSTGPELWKSDGTEQGTVLVKDINPGSAVDDSNPRELTNVNGTLFFVTDDGISGQELWRSDGTDAGTVLVKDIRQGEFHSNPMHLTAVGDTLYFTATHIDYARELWKSDGTEEGTVLVKDINPGGSFNNSNPDQLTDVDGTLFFQADDGVNGIELWKSDGTESGTVMVKNIRNAHLDSNPNWLTNVNGTLFFAAEGDSGIATELWKSDGTEQGTVLIRDIHETGGSFPVRLQNVDGLLMFSANDGVHGRELWASDGTETGTYLVKDINPGLDSSQPNTFGNQHAVLHRSNVAAGNRLFFRAYDGTTDTSLGTSGELWVSDGTEQGTFQVKDIHPDGESQPRWITAIGNNVFFQARDGVHHDDLFFSDGTEGGTFRIDDFRSDGGPSSPSWLANVNGILMLSATDGNIAPQGHGRELWKVELINGEICDNGIDDDGDGLIDGNDEEDCPSPGIGLAVACLHDPIYPMTEGDAIQINARAIDRDGNPVVADVIEIWWTAPETIATAPALAVENVETASFTFTPTGDAVIYSCYARRDPEGTVREDYHSGWRLVDIGEPETPTFRAIPVLLHGPFEDKLDIVFFFDQDEYTGFADPVFLQDVGVLLRDGLFSVPWFVEFQSFFNIWIGLLPANSGPDPNDTDPSDGIGCLRQAPSVAGTPGLGGYATVYPFADAGAIVHQANCRDNAGSPGVFTITAGANAQVVAHEMGHRPFGLADEYCCASFGGYFRDEPFANLYGTEVNCQINALARGFDPLQCRSFVDTRPMTPEDWWIWEPSTVARDLMQQNGQYKVGDSEIDRMIWMIERCLSGEC